MAEESPTKSPAAASAPSNGDKDVPPPSEDVLNVNVGILGHVDSGKTSLVKTLSTLLSTAALDKSKQSRQRGMTLDLGFSCFFLQLPEHLHEIYPDKSKLQMTLVDCPGHASLIRTIIGGAQIIDMVLLVVDAYKGWQAQTTECLVLAELTSPNLVVALNKVDMFPEAEREAKLEEAKAKVRARLRKSRFPNAVMVGVSACIGGEKVAASTNTSALDSNNPTHNIDVLVDTLQKSLPTPQRNPDQAPFYFAIDHCFPIKGMGTVLTGTCLSGHAKVNDPIEFPTLGLERKVKSMQMFKRKTNRIQQGDRAGICVSSLDSNLLERGIAASPKAVQLLKGAIILVRKIPHYHSTLGHKQKFHISVGHVTVMATVQFWGARELAESQVAESGRENMRNLDGSALGGDANRAGLPHLSFDWNQDFLQQEGYLESLEEAKETDGDQKSKDSSFKPPPLQWALVDFQTPVYCPLNSLIIGSRLDAVDTNHTTTGGEASTASSCRLAFCGRLVEPLDPTKDTTKLRLFAPKQKQGVISRLGDPHKRQEDGKVVRYEVFGSDLFKKETVLKPFIGMKMVTPKGDIGELKGAFGTTGKFRVHFPAGTDAREGDALVLHFKRFANDPEKKMWQDSVLPKAKPGSRIEPTKKTKAKKVQPTKTGQVDKIKGDSLENGKVNIAIVAGLFSIEDNIRELALGKRVVIPSTNEEGYVSGSFGKAGKCKVTFDEGVSAAVGAKAELYEALLKPS